MNFNLKRKVLGKPVSKAVGKRKPVAFNDNNSSDDEEDNFATEMAKKARKVAKLVDKTEEFKEDEAIKNKTNTKINPQLSQLLTKILEGKKIREQEQLVAQNEQKEQQLKDYLNKNKDAIVFSSEAYKIEQDSLKLNEEKIREQEKLEAEELNNGTEFYSRMIKARIGEKEELIPNVKSIINDNTSNVSKVVGVSPAKVEDKLKRVQSKKPIQFNIVNSSDKEKKNDLLDKLMDFIKSKITEQDLIEAKGKYFERKRKATNRIDS